MVSIYLAQLLALITGLVTLILFARAACAFLMRLYLGGVG